MQGFVQASIIPSFQTIVTFQNIKNQIFFYKCDQRLFLFQKVMYKYKYISEYFFIIFCQVLLTYIRFTFFTKYFNYLANIVIVNGLIHFLELNLDMERQNLS